LTGLDPLNLPNWRKVVAIVAVAFCKSDRATCQSSNDHPVGALALSAEAIIAALTPVFALEYAGINPKILDKLDLSKVVSTQASSANVMNLLASFGGPPMWKISMLATLPLLTNGISSYFLVPLSIAIGRRPLLILCGLLAWVGGLWAGMSKSLDSHLAARCLQGLGAGAVEALIPLMVQDIIFIHNRNRAMSSIWAAQVGLHSLYMARLTHLRA
jgi:MFS family permease